MLVASGDGLRHRDPRKLRESSTLPGLLQGSAASDIQVGSEIKSLDGLKQRVVRRRDGNLVGLVQGKLLLGLRGFPCLAVGERQVMKRVQRVFVMLAEAFPPGDVKRFRQWQSANDQTLTRSH